MNTRRALLIVSLAAFAAACSKAEAPAATPQPAAQAPAAPAPAPAAPAPTPAAPAPVATDPAATPAATAPAPAGNRAIEEHRLTISNWPKAPVTATLNGEWVGQWDGDTTVPITALIGKNDLLVEVGGEPKSDLHVTVQAKRSGSWVNLLSLNYKDKPGKHDTAFVAK